MGATITITARFDIDREGYLGPIVPGVLAEFEDNRQTARRGFLRVLARLERVDRVVSEVNQLRGEYSGRILATCHRHLLRPRSRLGQAFKRNTSKPPSVGQARCPPSRQLLHRLNEEEHITFVPGCISWLRADKSAAPPVARPVDVGAP